MRKPDKNCVLTINGGSSSIKFSLYKVEETLSRLWYGEVEGIGATNTKLNFTNVITNQKNSINITGADRDAPADFFVDWLDKQEGFDSVKAIGHRIVHGMKHTEPERITTKLLDELNKISAYDPEHLPQEIKLIELFTKRYPDMIQVACFDTSFHTSMPEIAKLLPLPRRYDAMGIKRYGFHGLSYAYLLEELAATAGDDIAKGKIIMAHLGNGASLAAVKDGKSMDTTMGFTPTSGLIMGTRTGDLDPGVAWYLMETEKLSADRFSHLVNHESGLLGISGTSSDMRELMKARDTDSHAAEAIDMFCYQVRKWIGSFVAVLGGVDTLVFSGGIGENSAEVRALICSGLQFLGIEIDETTNQQNETIISSSVSKVPVRVIKTNEELMIARMVCGVLNYRVTPLT